MNVNVNVNVNVNLNVNQNSTTNKLTTAFLLSPDLAVLEFLKKVPVFGIEVYFFKVTVNQLIIDVFPISRVFPFSEVVRSSSAFERK